jgi:CheY-like chemotaxis protein
LRGCAPITTSSGMTEGNASRWVAACCWDAPPRVRSDSMRILFVENHEVFAATVIEEFLAGDDVTLVSSVAAAEAEVSAGRYDVALVDYDLDDAKGDEFVRRLRAGGSTMPVIAASSHAEGNDALMRAGADAICGKTDFSGISRVVTDVCSNAGEFSSDVEDSMHYWNRANFEGLDYRSRRPLRVRTP